MKDWKQIRKYHKEITRIKDLVMELVHLESMDEYIEILSPRILGPKPKDESDFNDLVDFIAEVFKRLPKEDAKILLFERNVLFITFFAHYTLPILPSLVTKWFIVFHPKISEGTREIPFFIIAHELAHCFLKHGENSKDIDREQIEFEANEQVKKWGFEKEFKVYESLERPNTTS